MRTEPTLKGTGELFTGPLQTGGAVGVATVEHVGDSEAGRRVGLAAGGAVQEGRAHPLPTAQRTETERMPSRATRGGTDSRCSVALTGYQADAMGARGEGHRLGLGTAGGLLLGVIRRIKLQRVKELAIRTGHRSKSMGAGGGWPQRSVGW